VFKGQTWFNSLTSFVGGYLIIASMDDLSNTGNTVHYNIINVIYLTRARYDILHKCN
jgi:hypothetical protein